MIGKKIKVMDYKFTYGEEDIYINVYGAFKYLKNSNRYIIYSYDDKKLYYGSFFVKDNIGTIMAPKNTDKDIINNFINGILSNNINNEYEIINLKEINGIQVIDELIFDNEVDINKLYEYTIPKEEVQEVITKKGNFSFAILGIILLFIVIGLFFFVNPEIITGKNKLYICEKSVNDNKLPMVVNEKINLSFFNNGDIINMNLIYDYVFTDVNYYNEFKNKNYFYKYIEEGDTYKFDDSIYTYRVFRSIDVANDFFLPNSEEDLIVYYKNNGYDCNEKEE